MKYFEVSYENDIILVKIVRLPKEWDMDFVEEFKNVLLLPESKVFKIEFSGNKWNSFNSESKEYEIFTKSLRDALIRFIYSDSIYIGYLKTDISNIETELLLAMDYIVYEDANVVGFDEEYMPVMGGLSYIFLRGGYSLLNLLYRKPPIVDLIEAGYLRGAKSSKFCLNDIFMRRLLIHKKIIREIFVENFHHISEIEKDIIHRVGK